MDRLSLKLRWGVIAAVCVGAIVTVWFLPPIPQSQSYHHFADQRTIAGIPRAFDVLSNLAFLLSGVLGLWFVLRSGKAFDPARDGPLPHFSLA